MTTETLLTYIFGGITVIVSFVWLIIYIMDRRAERRGTHPAPHLR